MILRRATCCKRNGDSLSLFCSPKFPGSELHKRLIHRRGLYAATESRRRMQCGPPHPAEGTTRLFPITCSACLVDCEFCDKKHELVLYPDPEGSAKYVTDDGRDHTCCPTLMADPLKTPSTAEVWRRCPRCIGSKIKFFGESAREVLQTAPPCQLQTVGILPSVSRHQLQTAPPCQLQTAPRCQLQTTPRCQLQTLCTSDIVSHPPPSAPVSQAPTPTPELPDWIKVGERIYCKYHNVGSKWDFATVTSVHDNNTIDFIYDDGDIESHVTYSDTRIEKVEINSRRGRRRVRHRVWTSDNFGGYSDENI